MKWIVFWFKEVRIGSVELTDTNWTMIKKTFIYDIIQTDITGTTHIQITAIKEI